MANLGSKRARIWALGFGLLAAAPAANAGTSDLACGAFAAARAAHLTTLSPEAWEIARRYPGFDPQTMTVTIAEGIDQAGRRSPWAVVATTMGSVALFEMTSGQWRHATTIRKRGQPAVLGRGEVGAPEELLIPRSNDPMGRVRYLARWLPIPYAAPHEFLSINEIPVTSLRGSLGGVEFDAVELPNRYAIGRLSDREMTFLPEGVPRDNVDAYWAFDRLPGRVSRRRYLAVIERGGEFARSWLFTPSGEPLGRWPNSFFLSLEPGLNLGRIGAGPLFELSLTASGRLARRPTPDNDGLHELEAPR